MVLLTQSLNTSAIVNNQAGGWSFWHWNIIHTAVIPFILFSIAITAEMTRAPFDLVEAEEELSGGYNLEYSSIDFAWFYLAEYAALVTNSAIIVTLWLGGPNGPSFDGAHLGYIWFTIKELVILYIFVWIRATLPRFRYDQLMDLGWKRLIPASLLMLMIVAGFQATPHYKGWIGQRLYGIAAIAASLFLVLLLIRAIDVGREATELESVREGDL